MKNSTSKLEDISKANWDCRKGFQVRSVKRVVGFRRAWKPIARGFETPTSKIIRSANGQIKTLGC